MAACLEKADCNFHLQVHFLHFSGLVHLLVHCSNEIEFS